MQRAIIISTTIICVTLLTIVTARTPAQSSGHHLYAQTQQLSNNVEMANTFCL
ncbi:MAG: hypothetical protein GFH27_549307n182 [Chloroflexi bacterium AL-W]|nr:hypothetical protein [Chloroflexi bacterium AL-N1]NOK69214.1 hypothetical protein [Chloroflexi bacterium AL-N10]NOK77197.1 hypothetical protein [Chloroflexi bacterium AL-N5]NOK83842.1 hypothetical protein [Chloroflexi bacterium AL-W]NOK91052.1 hypothetical protein [Chloroflexi bacterium AL-N15]